MNAKATLHRALTAAVCVLLVVAFASVASADTIKLRDYAGVSGTGLDVVDPTWQNVRIDDVSIVAAAGSYSANNFGGGGLNVGYAWDSIYGHVILLGVKNLTTILPKVDGLGRTLSITDAKWVFRTTRGITGDMTVSRVTSNWMLQAAGLSQGTGLQDDGITPEDGITGAAAGDGSTPWTEGVWVAGRFGLGDFSATDADVTTVGTSNWFPTMELDAIKALQGIYDSGVNYGFCVTAPAVLDTSPSTDVYLMSNESNQASDWSGNRDASARPGLIIEYAYVGGAASPEPDTLMLLGTGALGAIGLIRRRRIA